METKSRYEVISDLEKQKRDLIRERDGLDDEVKKKERSVKNLERQKEDITLQKKSFDMKQEEQKKSLEREKEEFDFKIENTEDDLTRKIADAKEDTDYYKTTVEKRKATINELIKGVDESLQRFGKLQN